MNNRIKEIFLKKSKKLLTFITAGDPDIKTSLKIMNKLVESGTDIIEIGMPFSDPMADGPTIQLSSIRAIKKNIDLRKIMSLCKEFRKKNKYTPIILMGYYNPIQYYGDQKFIKECSKVGIDGLIIVDLQPEYDEKLYMLSSKNNIDFIRLITPTTDKNRLKVILSKSSSFLYFVSITGITGQKSAKLKNLKKSINFLKTHTTLPFVMGFGIKNAKQAREMSRFSNGVVVGSSIIKIIEESINNKISKDKTIYKIGKFVKSLSKAIN